MHVKENQISQFLDCRSEPHYWPKPQVALALLSCHKQVIMKAFIRRFQKASTQGPRQLLEKADTSLLCNCTRLHLPLIIISISRALLSHLPPKGTLRRRLQYACKLSLKYPLFNWGISDWGCCFNGLPPRKLT